MTSTTFEFKDIFYALTIALEGAEGTDSYCITTNMNDTEIKVNINDWETSGYLHYEDSPAITIKHLLGKTWAVLKHKACAYGAEGDNVDLLGQSNYVISWNKSDADANDTVIEKLVHEVYRYMVPPENGNPPSTLHQCVEKKL